LTREKHGILGLYRGLSALIFFTVPKTASRFGSNEFLRNNVFTAPTRINTFCAGLCAGAVEAALVVTPAETLKVKLIHDKISERG
jgi:solute carrier family 25 citrate transporter 1